MTHRILVVRNDKLGDFMLAWPAFALLKKYLPEAHISALVPDYTAPMAQLCPFIDEVLIDHPLLGAMALARQLRNGRFDSLITFFSTGRVAVAALAAAIPYRLAPATKLAQLLYNQRLTQRRSRSKKPEYAYNLDLAWRMLADHGVVSQGRVTQEHNGDWLPKEMERPLLRLADERDAFKQEFCHYHGLDTICRLVFIHPGSGGSATNLRPDQYAHLANLLRTEHRLAFVITAGPGERETANRVAAAITAPVTVHDSSTGLAEFARTLQLADLFISGSTGPLHIAGALDVPTAAFYPRHRSATPLRWQTLNSPARRLAFTPPPAAGEKEVMAIDLAKAAEAISAHYLR